MQDQEFDYEETPIVLMREEGVMGVVTEYGAHISRVVYAFGGVEYDEIRENSDFVIVDNIIFKHIVEE